MTGRQYRRLRVSNAALDVPEAEALLLGCALLAGAGHLCGGDGELDREMCRVLWERHREVLLRDWAERWHGPAPTCWGSRVFDLQPQVVGLADPAAVAAAELIESGV